MEHGGKETVYEEEELLMMEDGKPPLLGKLLGFLIIPSVMAEIFFVYVLLNFRLSQSEKVLLAAGAVSAFVIGLLGRLLSLRMTGKAELPFEEDPEEEMFEKPAREKSPSVSPAPANRTSMQSRSIKIPQAEKIQKDPVGTQGTRYFAPSDGLENKLYGVGKNRQIIRLESWPFIVGKSKEHVDYQLTDSSVSRLHAKFTIQDGKTYMTDLNSTNGTYKNGLRLMPGETTPLEREDEVRIGKLEFAFR
ncbi:MAG: FHA domain-containing protein [Lachnospiraceae bacterium]|nr:FHA domain-containing protein [Lachnospiraceae bacterium]